VSICDGLLIYYGGNETVDDDEFERTPKLLLSRIKPLQ
jgi:hypothetical protein